MSMKNFVKKTIPPQFYHLAAQAYQLKSVPHYWFPYAFMNGKAFHPTVLTFEATFRCNLNCVMCPQAIDRQQDESKLFHNVSSREELTIKEIQTVLEQAAALGVEQFAITGGEPLIRPDAIDMLRFAKSLGLTTLLLTNGTLIKEQTVEKIMEADIGSISFSLDGPKETHEAIRKIKGSFDKLMQAIHLIQEAKARKNVLTPKLYLHQTISSLNVSTLTETMTLAEELGVDISFGYLFYTTKEMEEQTNQLFEMGLSKDENQEVEASLKQLDYRQLQEQVEQVMARAKQSKVRVNFLPPLQGSEVFRRFFEDEKYAYATKCFYPWYALRLNPYGDIYPCSMGVTMGNVREQNLDAIWNGEKYVRFRRALKKQKLFPKCAKCCVLNTKLWSHLPA